MKSGTSVTFTSYTGENSMTVTAQNREYPEGTFVSYPARDLTICITDEGSEGEEQQAITFSLNWASQLRDALDLILGEKPIRIEQE